MGRDIRQRGEQSLQPGVNCGKEEGEEQEAETGREGKEMSEGRERRDFETARLLTPGVGIEAIFLLPPTWSPSTHTLQPATPQVTPPQDSFSLPLCLPYLFPYLPYPPP